MNMKLNADVVIVGCGVSGLFCALNLPENLNITIITKSDLESSDSFLAQGGICVLKKESDYDSYFEDTMRAGHYENRESSVDTMIRSSTQIIQDLIGYGVDFERDEQGDFMYTREGGHSTPRILFHEDITGKEITSKLLMQVRIRPNIKLSEHMAVIDVIEGSCGCEGVVCVHAKEQNAGALFSDDYSIDRKDELETIEIYADYTVFASGGLGGIYKHSTNFRHLTGDALAISKRHGVRLKDIDYIQIHPTTFYSTKPGRRFLISESVRGEGAVLYDKSGNRFCNELLPRDVVTGEVRKQMEKDGTEYVMLSMEKIPKDDIMEHFPNIYQHCLSEGYDVTKESIPVVPAQHYFMGGIDVDSHSETTMNRLYAVGETSCNGVHGANRLASNSLLESLVFAKLAAHDMISKGHPVQDTDRDHYKQAVHVENMQEYTRLMQEYRTEIEQEIDRMRQERQTAKDI